MVWEVTFAVFKEKGAVLYKVTRRLPEMTVAETKTFHEEADALKQFQAWSGRKLP